MAGRESCRGRLTVPESLATGWGTCGSCLVCIFVCSILCAVSRAQPGIREGDSPLRLPCSGCWSWVRWGPYFGKGTACLHPGKACFQHSLPETQAAGKETRKLVRKGCSHLDSERGKDRFFLRAQRDCTGLAANWDPHWADWRLAQRLGSALQGQGWQGRHLLVSYLSGIVELLYVKSLFCK